jgi:hypothetical protein
MLSPCHPSRLLYQAVLCCSDYNESLFALLQGNGTRLRTERDFKDALQ